MVAATSKARLRRGGRGVGAGGERGDDERAEKKLSHGGGGFEFLAEDAWKTRSQGTGANVRQACPSVKRDARRF